jgi:hypothetical protein
MDCLHSYVVQKTAYVAQAMMAANCTTEHSFLHACDTQS